MEVQRTFYQPPRPQTAAAWRARAPADFVFTLKAWQLITHERSSPTYRRLREPLDAAELATAGGFRWNRITRMAWARTRESARALEAEAVLFQAPGRFRPTPENIARLRGFFTAIERDGRRMILELRGIEWDDTTVERLCRELDLVHAVDPFLRPAAGTGLQYLRLHGRPAYHYRYRYTDPDLGWLAAQLDTTRPARVLFNNDSMAEDARRFLTRLARRCA